MNLGLELNDKWLTLASESKASQEGRADIPSSDITQGDLSHKWIRVPATPVPRASTGPPNCDVANADCGMRTSPRVSASSPEVPLGTSGLSTLA
jgi:hypothetical protein